MRIISIGSVPGDCAASAARAPALIERLTADLATARRLLPPRYVAAEAAHPSPPPTSPE